MYFDFLKCKFKQVLTSITLFLFQQLLIESSAYYLYSKVAIRSSAIKEMF